MADSPNNDREVWITGIGIVSSLGEGLDAHWQALTADNPKPVVDEKSFAPYPIHPLFEIDFSKQIPKRGDLRQMEDWQRIGTYAAGLALDDAGIKGDEELLAKCHIIAAAGNGERDPEADATVLAALKDDPNWREKLNDLLLTNLRPTLYLAQQTQLLAGNISIVHKVTGGSRTFKGEEIAGVQIVENAVQRIQAGQGELFLVGAANNAARPDLHLIRELNGLADRSLGSMGAFLVIESAEHAKARGAKPYAKISSVAAAGQEVMSVRSVNDLEHKTDWTIGHVNAPPVFLSGLAKSEKTQDQLSAINIADLFGHGIESQFPLGMTLATLVCSKGGGQIQLSGLGRAMLEKVKS
ncbi:MAG: beta-ketoacyl-ACP synthase [Hyphomicrobiaceae bacterium]|nr:beta-ketoacyl-ACP synthase [Hyphomicrobiaceae bacterium]